MYVQKVSRQHYVRHKNITTSTRCDPTENQYYQIFDIFLLKVLNIQENEPTVNPEINSGHLTVIFNIDTNKKRLQYYFIKSTEWKHYQKVI